MGAAMSLRDRARAAWNAFSAPPALPAPKAERLDAMPSGAFAREIKATTSEKRGKKKRIDRLPIDYRRYMPPDIEFALDLADRSGTLGGIQGAGTIAAWVKANPIVDGITKGRTSIPWRPVGVKYSDEAAAWLEGSTTSKGWRKQICNPAELESIASDRFHGGWGGGIFIWNGSHPELQALDLAGFRYLPGEDRWQYHGWNRVFDVTPGDGIWVFDSLCKTDPWRKGAWHKIAYDNMGALNAAMLRELWQQVFSMPTVLAKSPLGASNEQKLQFTESVIGAALRVIGVSTGYELDFKQATAEGSDTFKQSEDKLREACSILTWGTIGLISGGSGFANADLFEEMKNEVIAEEGERQATLENSQVWPRVLEWAVRAGKLGKGAEQACIEYQTESAAVIKRKAEAAKALMDAGYTAEEAQRRVGLAKNAMPNVEPQGRVEELPEPTYSENMAERLNARNDATCPHKQDKYCPRCGVVRRYEERGGEWVEIWNPVRRRAA